jgi:hypothetical protein
MFLHPVNHLAAPGTVARQASFATPHAEARQGCHAGQARREGLAWARACRATCTGTTGLPHHPAWHGSAEPIGPARPPFFFLLPFFFSPSPPASGGDPAAVGRHTPKSGDLWWGKFGKSIPVSLGRYCPYLI